MAGKEGAVLEPVARESRPETRRHAEVHAITPASHVPHLGRFRPLPLLAGPALRNSDHDRAVRTARLISSLAPRMGVDVARLEILLAETAALKHRGARGLAHRHLVTIRPRGYDPSTPEGRYVLAHELAHIAQQERRSGDMYTPRRVEEQAEQEASEIGVAVSLDRAFESPKIAVPGSRQMADKDAEDGLENIVAQSRKREIQRIKKLVGGLWVSDNDVKRVMLTLQELEFFTARAVVRNLRSGERYDLVNNINDVHYERFRREIFACYYALTAAEVLRFDEDLLEDMDLTRLSDEEHLAAYYVISHLSHSAYQALVRSRNAYAVRIIMANDPRLELQREEEQRKQAEDEQKRLDEEASDKNRVTKDQGLADDLKSVLDVLKDPSEEDTIQALDLLSKYLDKPDDMRALARELEDNGALDRLLEELPVGRLFREFQTASKGKTIERVPGRQTLLLLLSFRPPYKNVELAEELTTRGLWDFFGSVSDEEAYLAFQLIKSVPQKSRASFLTAEEGKFWKRTQEEMSQDMRESETLNFYGGGKGQLDRASIEGPLLEPALWRQDRAAELDGRLRMAIAAGEHRWVFDLSERMPSTQGPAYTIPALVPLVEKYKLFNPEAMGPDGRKQPRTQYDPESLKGQEWWQAGAILGFFHTVGSGVSVIRSSDEFMLRWGGVEARNLDALEVQDFMGGSLMGLRLQTPEEMARGKEKPKPGQRANRIDRMVWDMSNGRLEVEAKYLGVQAVRYFYNEMLIQAGTGKIEDLLVKAGYPAWSDIAQYYLMVDAGHVVLNDVVLISADSMTAINRVELGGIKMRSGEGGVDYGKIPKATTEDAVFEIPVLAPLLGGLRAWGNTGELKKAFTQSAEFSIEIESIRLDGIVTSGGQVVESVEIQEVAFRTGEKLAGYKRALEESLASFPDRIRRHQDALPASKDDDERDQHATAIAQLRRQQEAVRKEIAQVERDEQEIAVLEKRQKETPDAFTDADRTRLNALKRGGAALDIGAVKVKGIGGATRMDNLDLFEVHGQGRLSFYKEGDSGAPVISSLDENSGLAIEVGQVRSKNFRMKSSPPSSAVLAKQIEKLKKKIETRPSGELDAELRKLEDLHEKVSRYEQLAARGLANVSEPERQEFLRLRNELYEQPGNEIGEINVEGGRIHLDFSGGLGDLIDFREKLRSAALGAQKLTLKDVKLPSKGVEVKKVTALETYAGIRRTGKEATATFSAEKIIVEGVNLERTQASLEEERKRLEGSKTPLTDKETSRLEGIKKALADLDELLYSLEQGQKRLNDANTEQEKQEAEQYIVEIEKLMEAWRRELVVQELSVDNLKLTVSGLGDIFAADYDSEAAVRKGIAVSAEFDEAKVKGANLPGLSAEELTAKKFKGQIIYSEDSIRLESLSLGSVEIDAIHYMGAGASVATTGKTILNGITVSATIRLDTVVLDSSLNAKSATTVHVDELIIEEITAPQLTYTDIDDKDRLRTINVDAGGMKLLRLEQFDIAMPHDQSKAMVSGKISAQSIDNFAVRASIEKSFGASGTISAKGLDVQLFSSGEKTFKVQDLDISKGEYTGADGNKVRVSVTDFKGGAKIGADGWIETDIEDIGAITVGHLEWFTSGHEIFTNRPLTLAHVKLKAAIKPGGKEALDEVRIDELVVRQVVGNYLRFTQKEKDLTIEIKKEDPKAKEAALDIRNIRVYGLRWRPKQGVTKGTVKVESIASQLTVALGTDLNLGVKMLAKKLEVDFYEQGRLVTDLQELNASVKGKAYGAEVDATLDKLNFHADIDKRKIQIDRLGIEQVTLSQLELSSPKFGIKLGEGGSITLKKLFTSLTVNLTPAPEPGSQAPGKKPPSPIENITINELLVPETNVAGLTIELKQVGEGVKISLPAAHTGTIHNLRIEKPAAGEKPFTLRPKGDEWQVLGQLKADKAELKQIGVDIKNTLSLTTNATAEGISIGFLDDGSMPIDVDKTTLTELEVEVSGTKFSLGTGLDSNKKLKEQASATVHKLHYDEKSGVSTGRIDLSGFVIERPKEGLTIDITKAHIPVDESESIVKRQGLFVRPGEEVYVSKVIIEDAFFNVVDLSKLMPEEKPGAKAAGNPLDLTFLDTLDGKVKFNLWIDVDYLGPFLLPVDTVITEGKVNYTQIRSRIFEDNHLIDFEVDDDQLLLEVKTPVYDYEIISWALNEQERELAEKEGKAKISTLAKGGLRPSLRPDPNEPPSDDPFVNEIEIRDADIDLSTKGSSVIDLGDKGKIIIGPEGSPGISHLTVKGSTKRGLMLGLGEANVAIKDLLFGLDIGKLTIKNVHDTRLGFAGITPLDLSGVVGSATAEGIRVKLAPEKKGAK